MISIKYNWIKKYTYLGVFFYPKMFLQPHLLCDEQQQEFWFAESCDSTSNISSRKF